MLGFALEQTLEVLAQVDRALNPTYRLAEFKDLVENGKEISDVRGIQQESLYQNFLVNHF